MYRVKLAFSKLTIPEKIQKAGNVAGKLDGNEHFPAPDPSVAEIEAAVKALDGAHKDAMDGGKSKTVTMHDREGDLDDIMVRVGAYVQNTSKGDREIILSSGLEVRNTPSQSHPAEAPENLSGKPGTDEGEVILSWEAVDSARAYTAQVSTDGGATWTACGVSTKGRLTVGGLASGSKPLFRVAAIGPLGQGPWSDAAQGKVA